MLSAASSYDLTATLVQTPARIDRSQLGTAIATNGNLALIGAVSNRSATFQGDPLYGFAQLIDTSNNQTLRVFDDPGPIQTVGDQFGNSVAFVNGKIAIAQPQNFASGAGHIYIYSNASDTTPVICDNIFPNDDAAFATQMVSVGNNLYVSVQSPTGVGSHGVILRYDSSTGGLPTATYTNTLTTGDDQFGYQMIVRGTDIFAYGVGNTGPAVYKLDTTSGDITLFSDTARTGNVAFAGTQNTPRTFAGTVAYSVVPEPTTLCLLGVGGAFALLRWRKKARA